MSENGKTQILYIEDDPGLANLTRMKLERNSYSVDIAADGEQGLAMIGENEYDLLITDYMMPGYDGIELIKKLSVPGPLPPLIMVTGAGDEKVAIEAMKLGASDYIVKSIDTAYLELLPAVIDKVLQKHRLATEKLEAENALKESEERYRRLAENAPVIIFRWSMENGLDYVNPALTRITGYTPDEFIANQELVMEIAGMIDTDIATDYGNFVSGGVVLPERELMITRKDGQTAFLKILSVPIGNNGTVTGFEGIAEDITARKRAESEIEGLMAELGAKNTEILHLSHSISHHFTTHLDNMRQSMERLNERSGNGDAEANAELETIAGEIYEMAGMLAGISEMSQFGFAVNKPEKIDMGELVRKTAESVITDKNAADVELSIQPDMPVVYGERLLLCKLIRRLIDNAVKFRKENEKLCIEIRMRMDGETPVCCVKDNGIGVEPKNHEKIFSLFERLNASAGGSGSGLAIARYIAGMHGENLWVESDGAGAGSIFCLSILTREAARKKGIQLPG